MMKERRIKLAPIGLSLAFASALVSAGLYIVRRTFDIYLQVSLGVLILGLAAFILLVPDRVRRALTGRQARYGSNALVLSIATLGILVVVNYFTFENSQRWDLTEDKQNTLTGETLETIDALPGEVTAQAFFSAERNPDYARSLLNDYKYFSDGAVSYEFIDPISDPISAQTAGITLDGSVVFWLGDRKQIVTSITEQEFTAALVRLVSGEGRMIYFTTGHGEFSPDDSDDQGLSQAKQVLESKNYTISTLNLLSAAGVPVNANVVVVAGPVYPFEISEVTMLSDYLDSGGALILMQDSPVFSEFGDQLDELAGYLQGSWGILLGQDMVMDPTSYLAYTAPVGVANQNHPISSKLQGVATAFPTARSVQASEGSSGTVLTTLITTANDGSWAETDLESLQAGDDIAYDPDVDTLGPVSIAVVAENASTNSRVAVFGDANFAMNANFTFFGNGDLFVSSVDWVVGQEDLISLTPNSPIERYMLPPQPYLMNLILLFVVFLLPGTVLGAGIVVWIQRHRRG